MSEFSKKKRICLILPSLKIGGMERIMLEIAKYLLKNSELEVHLIIFSRHKNSYNIPDNLIIHEPRKKNNNYGRIFMQLSQLFFLRNKLKIIKPYSLLSFGSMYNSFVILASLGLGIRTFISDRSNPYRNCYLRFKRNEIERHDGVMHYFLRRILYKKATGIVVQTDIAYKINKETLKHKNIIKIPNPVRKIESDDITKENIILNVGRFIGIKQQDLLLKIFAKIEQKEWILVFAGDGPELNKVKALAEQLKISKKVQFLGNLNNIDDLFLKSEIFAFTSKSEGFPNSLAEALRVPLASISFDCVAGPSELIEDGYNGFLVPVNDVDEYRIKLSELISNADLRLKFKANSLKKMKEFEYDLILSQFHKLLI